MKRFKDDNGLVHDGYIYWRLPLAHADVIRKKQADDDPVTCIECLAQMRSCDEKLHP